jgi:hypothetical protein
VTTAPEVTSTRTDVPIIMIAEAREDARMALAT